MVETRMDIERRSVIRVLLLALLIGGALVAGEVHAQSDAWTVMSCDPSGAVPEGGPRIAYFRGMVDDPFFFDLPAEFRFRDDGGYRPDSIAFGLDLWDRSGRSTDATPPFLDGGATYGTSATLRGGVIVSSAVVATEQGDVPLAGRASLWVDEGGSTTVGFPPTEFPAGIDLVRITVVIDDVLCAVWGDSNVDDGYVPATTYASGFQELLDGRDSVHLCNVGALTCLNLPRDLAVTPSGDGAFDVVYEGLNFGVQFYSAGGRSDDVLTGFLNAGWLLENATEIAAPHRDWQGFDLGSGAGTLGSVVVSDNGSSVNPAAFAVVITSPATLSDEQVLAMDAVRRTFAEGFNSAFEALP